MQESNARWLVSIHVVGITRMYKNVFPLRSRISLFQRQGHNGNHAIGMKDQIEFFEIKSKIKTIK